jgi:DNA polymerase III alpha subunit
VSQFNAHCHTEGSFLDGQARVDQVMTRAKECGHEFVTITDHGECNQHLAGAKAAAKAGPGLHPRYRELLDVCRGLTASP